MTQAGIDMQRNLANQQSVLQQRQLEDQYGMGMYGLTAGYSGDTLTGQLQLEGLKQSAEFTPERMQLERDLALQDIGIRREGAIMGFAGSMLEGLMSMGGPG